MVERAQAAKFVIHFVGDIHQPLHTEDVAKGGNGITVFFDEKRFNLHHVWDSSIAEKLVSRKEGHGVGRKPFPAAKKWAEQLAEEIREGVYKGDSKEWIEGLELKGAEEIALEWAVEGNAHVCTVGKFCCFSSPYPVLTLSIAKSSANTAFVSPPRRPRSHPRPRARRVLLRSRRARRRVADRQSRLPSGCLARFDC